MSAEVKSELLSRCKDVLYNISVHGEQCLPLGHFHVKDIVSEPPNLHLAGVVSPILRTVVDQLRFTKFPDPSEDPPEPPRQEVAVPSKDGMSDPWRCYKCSQCNKKTVVHCATQCNKTTVVHCATQHSPSVTSVGIQVGRPDISLKGHGSRRMRDSSVKDEHNQSSHFRSYSESQKSSSSAPPRILPPPPKGILKTSKPTPPEPKPSSTQSSASVPQMPTSQPGLLANLPFNLAELVQRQQQQRTSPAGYFLSQLMELQNLLGGAGSGTSQQERPTQ